MFLEFGTICGDLQLSFLLDLNQVITDPDLRERHLGDLQGLVFREAAKLSPNAYKAFISHRTAQDIPVR